MTADIVRQARERLAAAVRKVHRAETELREGRPVTAQRLREIRAMLDIVIIDLRSDK